MPIQQKNMWWQGGEQEWWGRKGTRTETAVTGIIKVVIDRGAGHCPGGSARCTFFFLTLSFIFLFSFSGEVTKLEGGYSKTGKWEGLGCMLRHFQRIDNEIPLKKIYNLCRPWQFLCFYSKNISYISTVRKDRYLVFFCVTFTKSGKLEIIHVPNNITFWN